MEHNAQHNVIRPIFLVGYMASGKTTFGRALARRMGRDFIDLDFYIEQRFRRPVSAIFAECGEGGFRLLEKEMLREAGEFENVVVACGGGTPCFHGNMDYMLSRGLTVWITATVDRIVDRLVINNSRRPLMAGKSREEIREAVVSGLAQRERYYSRAAIRFSGQQLENIRQISDSVDDFIRVFLP